MIRKKINSYKKLDNIIISIVTSHPQPITASQIGEQITKQYSVSNLDLNNRSIAMRLRGQPGVKVIPGKYNKYTRKVE